MTEAEAPLLADRSDRSRRPSGQRSAAWAIVRDVALIVVVSLLISFLVKSFLVRSFFIPSESMNATLIEDDRILVNQLIPELAPVERGDVVVFRDPGGLLPPNPTEEVSSFAAVGEWVSALVGLTAPDSDEHLVKRVIGTGGDVVECCNDLGQLSVNGVPLDESYLRLSPTDGPASLEDFTVEVADGELWVMGDNRNNSADSRRNGPVPISDVVGRAVVVSWPLDRWSWLDYYPLVFDGVDEARGSR